jgi:hypothetical protein
MVPQNNESSRQFPVASFQIVDIGVSNWKLETGNWQLFPEEDER